MPFGSEGIEPGIALTLSGGVVSRHPVSYRLLLASARTWNIAETDAGFQRVRRIDFCRRPRHRMGTPDRVARRCAVPAACRRSAPQILQTGNRYGRHRGGPPDAGEVGERRDHGKIPIGAFSD